jgi:hypothetical protein
MLTVSESSSHRTLLYVSSVFSSSLTLTVKISQKGERSAGLGWWALAPMESTNQIGILAIFTVGDTPNLVLGEKTFKQLPVIAKMVRTPRCMWLMCW